MFGSLRLSVSLAFGLGCLIAASGKAVTDPTDTGCDSEKLEYLQLKCAGNGTLFDCTEDEQAELETQSSACSDGENIHIARDSCIEENESGCRTYPNNPKNPAPANKRCCKLKDKTRTNKCQSEGSRTYCRCYYLKERC